jgi:flagellin-specific chaperone FliS
MGLLDDKKRDNIASYVISMWHIEDLMRANDFDMDKLEEVLIAPMEADEDARAEVRGWYAGVVTRMKEQGLQVRGHLSEVEEVLTELEFLHNTLHDVLNDSEYDQLFAAAEPGITALQRQADENADGPITTCFTAIYGVMVLRAREQAVSESTAEAEQHMRKLLERLSQHYKQMRKLPGISMN